MSAQAAAGGSTAQAPLLAARGLQAWYGATQVLFGLDFSLAKGRITALLGANGAGKTTTLRALCQMVRTAGSLRLDGAELVGSATESVVRRGVAHVPDGRGTFTALTVEENLRLGARRMQQAGTLSGGEQQMLAISRALMLRPRLLLLDEPSFGLAPRVVEEIFEIMRQINQEDGTTMLLVEQNAALALELADEAYLLETGRIALSGPSERMQRDENVRRTYLGMT